MQIFVYDFHHSIATRTPSRKVNSEKLKVDAFQQAVHVSCFSCLQRFFKKTQRIWASSIYVIFLEEFFLKK